MGGQIQYDFANDPTSETTPAPDTNLGSRLDRLRQELGATTPHRTRSDLERLTLMAQDLDLRDTDLQEKVEEIRAEREVIDLADRIARLGLPIVEPLDSLPPGERCHFVTPVQFGRRRTDQGGHLELTSERLRFRGVLDLGVVWSEVSTVERDGHNIIVSLVDSRRELRFCCHCTGESARGVVIARRLARAAAARRGEGAGARDPV